MTSSELRDGGRGRGWGGCGTDTARRVPRYVCKLAINPEDLGSEQKLWVAGQHLVVHDKGFGPVRFDIGKLFVETGLFPFNIEVVEDHPVQTDRKVDERGVPADGDDYVGFRGGGSGRRRIRVDLSLLPCFSGPWLPEFLVDYGRSGELWRVVEGKVDRVGVHWEPATRAVKLFVGGHPECVEGAGDHSHLCTRHRPPYPGRSDPLYAGFVPLGVFYPEEIDAFSIVDISKIDPNLVWDGISILVPDGLELRGALKPEGGLERTGGEQTGQACGEAN